MTDLSSSLVIAVTAYIVGVASPGPSTMAIMATALARGRAHALAFAGGVICGSLFWGFSAAAGLAALMRAYSWSLVVLKVLGGVYMLWLAWKAAREALSSTAQAQARDESTGSLRQSYARGLALHLTNPKAIFVWLSIVALGLPAQAERSQAFQVVAACAACGVVIFLGYAVAFSTAAARNAYARVRRWFNAALCLVFAYAGLRLLLQRSQAA